MASDLEPKKTVCLLNGDAQCNTVWVSQPNGIELAHFQTFSGRVAGTRTESAWALFDKCERHCLPGGGRP